jgi:UMF1 family MFS transporter
MKGVNKKIFYWGLYDFANSLIVSNITLYLSQWLIVDNGMPPFWYGIAIAVSTILLLLTAPILGSSSDRSGKKMGFIRPLTFAIGSSTLLIGIIGTTLDNNLITLMFLLGLFVVFQFAYQLSLVFYDTLLASLAEPKDYGRVSGFGEGMGSLGHIAGLFFTYPFINGGITLFGEAGRIQAFIPSAIGFLILSAPMIWNFKDTKINKNYRKESFVDILDSFKDLLKNKNMLWFLMAFYFISDVILTIQTLFPIYFEEVLGFSDFQKIQASILILAFIIIGAVTLGGISDRIGFRVMTLITTIVLLTLFFIFPLIRNANLIWYFLPIAGLFWGGFYSAARAFLTKLSPVNKRGEFFSLFAIFRRSASIVGPIIWSGTVAAFSHLGPDKYRVSVYPLIFFMLIGFIFLSKVKENID